MRRSYFGIALLGWPVFIAFALVFGIIGAVVRSKREQSAWVGFVAGAALGPVGVLIVLASTPRIKVDREREALMLARAQSGYARAAPNITAEPRWLPDPSSRHELRYHDGFRFTADVMDDGVRGSDPDGAV